MTAPRFELASQRQKVSRLPTKPPGRPAVQVYLDWVSTGMVFKRNLNASKPSEHPPQVEECLKV